MTAVFPITWWLGLLMLAEPPATKAESDGLVTTRIGDRIVRVFDFDEKKFGNYESMPRSWRQIREPGYPRFLEPEFDFQVGHTAPPSFRFALSGGNIGAVYVAKDVHVYPEAEYQITAWVRPAHLVYARARLTAYYLDHAFQKIEGSERASVDVFGAGQDEPWRQVSIHLPGGFKNARWLGLSCRVEQAAERTASIEDLRPINYRDVLGTAWFDDIAILRLPRLILEPGVAGNVFTAEQEVKCTVGVADFNGADLDAKLEVVDVEQRVVQTHPIAVVGLEDPPAALRLDGLPAGWYSALLSVEVGEKLVLTRRLAFVRLNPDLPHETGKRDGFGIIVDLPPPGSAASPAVIERLVKVSDAAMVKFPLWRRGMSDAAVVEGDARLDSLVRTLHEDGVGLVAVLEEPPESLARLCGHPKLTLIDVLSSPPDQWRPYLDFVAARYGRQIQAWQIGIDEHPTASSDKRLSTALANIRSELKPLIGSAELAIPQSVYESQTESSATAAEVVSFSVPSQASEAMLAEQLASISSGKQGRAWAIVEAPSPNACDRKTRLIELARRAVVARHSGIGTVFLRQPWTLEEAPGGMAVEPAEELMLCRTLAQSLGGLEALSPVWLDHGVHAWLFGDSAGTNGAIVAWTEAEHREARRIVVDVGRAARQVDMWGQVSEPTGGVEGRLIEINAMPTIIAPISLARGKLLASFAVDEPALQATVQEQRRTITLANPRASKLHGTLMLALPARWRVQPSKLAVDLNAGEQARIGVSFVIPTNQAVGEYALQAVLVMDEGEPASLTLRAPLYVASPGLDVGVAARREAQGVAIVQRVTNLTEQAVNLHAMMLAPGRAVQDRTILNLPPGQSAIREYRLDNAASLRGQFLRVSVEQVSGAVRNNTLLKLD